MFRRHENPAYVARAAVLGAAGYLMKGATKDEIVAASQPCIGVSASTMPRSSSGA
jgi:DNA-binding NarL/FixJ family response regulator